MTKEGMIALYQCIPACCRKIWFPVTCPKLNILKKAKDTCDYAQTSEHSAVAIDDFMNSVRDMNLVPAVECN
jgi:hypothetical protein